MRLRVPYIRLWAGLVTILVIFGITLHENYRRTAESEPLIDKASAEIREPAPDDPASLVQVGFTARETEPSDHEVQMMADEVIGQVLGPQGLAAIVKPGDKVVIKVNIVGPEMGKKGEKGRGIITDPRIVRHIAEKVRQIIGFGGTADLKVVDTTCYTDRNPSLKSVAYVWDDRLHSPLGAKKNFYWARLERDGDDDVDEADICYDRDGDGILDGDSKAKLVNLDSLGEADRMSYRVRTDGGHDVTVSFPKFLRTKKEAGGSGEYCDVLIGLPVFKNHGYTGMTGALKLHYGFRYLTELQGDTGRLTHSGLFYDATGFHQMDKLLSYLCAQHLIRTYDFILMDCLTGNRNGPTNGSGLFDIKEDMPVDYLMTHAMMASRDPVAIDTAAAALAGYAPGSVGLLEMGRENGLGSDRPGWISIDGLDNYCRHRRYLEQLYQPKGRYPFRDGWGGARVARTISAHYCVETSERISTEIGRLTIAYSVRPLEKETPTLARVELWLDGKMTACRNVRGLDRGEFSIDSKLYSQGTHQYRVAVWDAMFNCTVSDWRTIKGRAD